MLKIESVAEYITRSTHTMITEMHIAECRRNLRTTILHRAGGTWSSYEVGKLVSGLMTEASEHSQYPEHLILFGHFSKQETLEALGGARAYTVNTIVGTDNEALPFLPGFA